MLTRRMHIVRGASALPTQNDDVTGRKAECREWFGRMGRSQNQSCRCHGAGKGRPVIMAAKLHILPVIHTSTSQFPIIKQKTTGLDDVQRQVNAGTKPHDRACILRNIRFKKGD